MWQRVRDAAVIGFACIIFDSKRVADVTLVSEYVGAGDGVCELVVDGRQRDGVHEQRCDGL